MEIKYINRELSWLNFNARVLHEIEDVRTPLLERVRFLSIFSSNLDEFFMKRVGGLKRQVAARVPASGIDRQSPQVQLQEIRRSFTPLIEKAAECITTSLIPGLESQGIFLLKWEELTSDELHSMDLFFERSLFPVLTPLSVDPGHPFPFISNLSTSFGILLSNPQRPEEELFARIKVPSVFPSWIRLNPDKGNARFVSLTETIAYNLPKLFPGMEILDVMVFRVTRNADVEFDQEDADDLLELVAEELKERKFAQVVRLEHGPKVNAKMLEILQTELEIESSDIYSFPVSMEYFDTSAVYELSRPDLKYTPWIPVIPESVPDPDASLLEAIRNNDILVHHPYESFMASVERFVRTAVEDPHVIAIKMTLYRTGEDSPFIPLLIQAAESGKQVVCLVELKARFDEARNILVAQALEKAGVHVVYGIVGLKTHSKVVLVVRRESQVVRCYAHIGTGNYHARTSRLYTDFGLFTARSEITDDVVQLFHYLTGRSLHWSFRELLVAPIDMKPSFLRMIRRENEQAQQGQPAHIIAKINSLEDEEIIEALCQASTAGVDVDLIVRGVCCLRPGIPGLSERIRVISIVGRFLEHARVFYFRNGAVHPAEGEFFIGSADWMFRNLNARVEAVAPIRDISLRRRVWEIIQLQLGDERQAWEMDSEGKYRQRGDRNTVSVLGSQELLMIQAKEREFTRRRLLEQSRGLALSAQTEIRSDLLH